MAGPVKKLTAMLMLPNIPIDPTPMCAQARCERFRMDENDNRIGIDIIRRIESSPSS
jgi:hypothetical protein